MGAFTTAAIVGGIVAGAGSLGGAAINARAAGKAQRAQLGANSRAMTIEQENEMRRREEFDRTERDNRTRWEIEQDREQQRYEMGRNDNLRAEAAGNARWSFDQKRREPYRAAGRGAVEELARIGGITMKPGEPPPDLAQGWTPGSMSPPTSTPEFTPRMPPQQPSNRTMADLAR
jgi:hypothetical protein